MNPGGDPGVSPRPLALHRCVGDVEAFLREHWGRWPLHHRSGDGFDDLLSLESLDHILTTMSLRLPAFRLVMDGTTLPTSSYTKSGRTGSQPVTGFVDPPRMYELFRQGATIVLQGVHRFWPPVAGLSRHLDLALGHPTQVNAYVTPPGSRGLAVHRDTHDVFVLQAFGSKHWDAWAPGSPVADAAAGADPVLSVELQPGESLYLPVNTPHAARTQDVVSGHLTVGIQSTSWGDVLREVARRVADDEAFAERLPAAFHEDPEAFATAVRDRLEELLLRLGKVDPGDVARARIRSFLTSRPSAIDGTLAGLIELGSITDTTAVRRREGTVCVLMADGDHLLALLGDRELRMPGELMDVMRFVAEQTRFRTVDLGAFLDPESRVVLVRRLVREGLLEVTR